ncbi:MAG TPA: XRE family transcriptional regulator [Steroidobacteraceae bacterium]|nr:XRE family transcriptional regulator [Steroidobacteraceae bacterium]
MAETTEPLAVEAITSRIAGRIRALRAERAFSLEELAERSGVSRSMLSLIEREESSPTAVILNKIAASFGVPLAAFFEDPATGAGPVSHATDRQPWRDPQTGYLREVLSPSGVAAPFQLVQVSLPAGATVQYEGVNRARPYHQQIWVLEGKIEVSFGAQVHHLEEGDCLARDVDGRPSSFSNPSRRRARYAVVIALS